MSLPAAEHLRDSEAFWDPDAPPGEIEPLEMWIYEQWGQVGGHENKLGLQQFLRWCSAPRPNRQNWHTELHKAVLFEQESEDGKTKTKKTNNNIYNLEQQKHNKHRKHRHDID